MPIWQDQYRDQLEEVGKKADSGQLSQNNQILQDLKNKGKNLPDLAKRVRELESKAK